MLPARTWAAVSERRGIAGVLAPAAETCGDNIVERTDAHIGRLRDGLPLRLA